MTSKNPITRLSIPYTGARMNAEPGWRGFAPGSQVSVERPTNPLFEAYKLHGLDAWGTPHVVAVPYRVLYHAVMYGFVHIID